MYKDLAVGVESVAYCVRSDSCYFRPCFDRILFRITVPRSVFIFTWMLDIMSGGIRIINDQRKGSVYSYYKNVRRLLITGAGDAGVLVAKELFRQDEVTCR